VSLRIWHALTWVSVAASAAGWTALLSRPLAVHALALASAPPPTDGDLHRLLGPDPPPPASEIPAPASPRFRLIGVIAPTATGPASRGFALITVDDHPARAFRVGSTIDGQIVLQAVSARGVKLGRDGDAGQILLDLAPVDAMPSTAPPLRAASPAVASLAQAPAGAFGGPPRAQPIQSRGSPAAVPAGRTPGPQFLPPAQAAPATSTVPPAGDPPPFGAPPRSR
jgi:general secretion pathway protein C